MQCEGWPTSKLESLKCNQFSEGLDSWSVNLEQHIQAFYKDGKDKQPPTHKHSHIPWSRCHSCSTVSMLYLESLHISKHNTTKQLHVVTSVSLSGFKYAALMQLHNTGKGPLNCTQHAHKGKSRESYLEVMLLLFHWNNVVNIWI